MRKQNNDIFKESEEFLLMGMMLYCNSHGVWCYALVACVTYTIEIYSIENSYIFDLQWNHKSRCTSMIWNYMDLKMYFKDQNPTTMKWNKYVSEIKTMPMLDICFRHKIPNVQFDVSHFRQFWSNTKGQVHQGWYMNWKFVPKL